MTGDIERQLRDWADKYNDPVWFTEDPIAFPTRFAGWMKEGKACLQDVEVAAVFAAHFAWGRRAMIVRDCGRPMTAQISQLPVDPTECTPEAACSCGCREFLPETSVLDTWATSSMTPFINAANTGSPDSARNSALNPEGKLFPMGMRAQAHEIIRTWAFYTIAKSLYHTGKLPWKDLMISGYVLAKPQQAGAKAEKISKSKNNAGETPTALISTYSADAVRVWTAAGRLGTDTYFDAGELKISARFITKLYNAAKFTELQLADYSPSAQPLSGGPEPAVLISPEKLLPIDRWILSRAAETTSRAAALLDDYEAGLARQEIDHFFWDDFCDYYLEIVKDRLYKPQIHGEEARRSAQYALFRVFLCLLKLYAIYTPYVTEHLYQRLYRQPGRGEGISLHELLWDMSCPEKTFIAFGERFKEVVAEVRRYKAGCHMSLKEEIPELTITCSEEFLPLFQAEEKDLLACTRAAKIVFH